MEINGINYNNINKQKKDENVQNKNSKGSQVNPDVVLNLLSACGNVSFGALHVRKHELSEIEKKGEIDNAVITLLHELETGETNPAEGTTLNNLENDMKQCKEILLNHVDKNEIDNDFLNDISQVLSYLSHYIFSDTAFTDDENKFFADLFKKYDIDTKNENLRRNFIQLEMKYSNFIRHIYDITYCFKCHQENNRLSDEEFNAKKISEEFRTNTAPYLNLEQLNMIYNLLTSGRDAGIYDFSSMPKRKPDLFLNPTNNNYYTNIYLKEFLLMSDEDYKTAIKKLSKRPHLRELLNSNQITPDIWFNLLNLSDEEYEKFIIPVNKRTQEKFDAEKYLSEVKERIKVPVIHSEEDIEILKKNITDKGFLNVLLGTDEHQFRNLVEYKKVMPKNVKNIKIPYERYIKTLNETGKVQITTENKGGANPVNSENPVIHAEDKSKLGIKENARIKIKYGAKIDWNNVKIARDIMQNFYDGNGHTTEGTDINIQKNSDGTYKVRITGLGKYDYSHLQSLGDSTKDNDSSSAGNFGEGTRIVAVNLLSKGGTNYVKYGCGEWSMEFGRSSDDLKTADMTQTLTKNEEYQDGNYIEFDTADDDLIKKIIESKDYFYNPDNPDFKDFDVENDYIGIKFFSDKEAKGNLYLVQRFEYFGKEQDSMNNVSIVFKKMPNDEGITKANFGYKFNLTTGRDRISLSNQELRNLISRYLKTLSDDNLHKLICLLEPCWNINTKENYKNSEANTVLYAALEEISQRETGIDFSKTRYVVAQDDKTAETLRIYDYIPADGNMTKAGMSSNFTEKEKPLIMNASEEVSRRIRLLDEGIRILEENVDLDNAQLIKEGDADKPKFAYNDSLLDRTIAEAVIDGGEYKGHWIKEAQLLMGSYTGNLATWLHELSHKSGGDNTENFSYQLIQAENFLIKLMVHNPEALIKLSILADLYQNKEPEISANKTPFDIEKYKTDIAKTVNDYGEYHEYIQTEESTDSVPQVKPENIVTKKTQNSSPSNISSMLQIQNQKSKKGKIRTLIQSIFGRKAQSVLPQIDMAVKSVSDVLLGTKSKGIAQQPQQKPESQKIVFPYIAPPVKEITNKESSADRVKQIFDKLEENGSVTTNIENKGGANPVNSEKPVIHEKDKDKLGITESARIKIKYGAKTNWNDIKIARDIMQNFYDGNGHTLEGTGIKIDKNDDGTYKIRITGLGNYDYSHLESLGDSTKDDDTFNAGTFGEGTRIVAVSLLANFGSSYIKYGCGEWSMEFGKSSDDIQNADMTQTLNKNEKNVDGNYIEFNTTDVNLVKRIIEAKDYFYHPDNPDFQNLDFENEYFGFKITPNNRGNLYYIQRFQTEDGHIENGLRDMTLIFKQAKNAIKTAEQKAVFSMADSSHGRDRTSFTRKDIEDFGEKYAKTLTNEELVRAISYFEPIMTDKKSNSSIVKPSYKDMTTYFFDGILREAGKNRHISVDFSDAKIVYVKLYTQLDKYIEKFLLDKGYKFAYSGYKNIGAEAAEDVYKRLNLKHSVKPTECEAKRLKILFEAVKLFAQNDKYNLLKKAENKPGKFFVYEKSDNKADGDFQIITENGKYAALFIDRNAISSDNFMKTLSYVISEIIDEKEDVESPNYSYDLTNILRTELTAFVENPEIAAKLKVLEELYKAA